jgi:hypothetical protein
MFRDTTTGAEPPINKYGGMNPKFVHMVWEKRKRKPEPPPPQPPELGWVSPREQPITPRDQVMMDVEDVANRYGYTLQDIIVGSARNKEVSKAKNAAMWMLRFTRGLSLPMIGSYLNVHHATAVYGIGCHMERMNLQHQYVEAAKQRRERMVRDYYRHRTSQAA